MSEERPNRVNVQLDDEHAARLYALASRTYVQPGTLARSLLSTALDQIDPDAPSITALLDSIPDAWDRVQRGAADAEADRVVPLDQL